MEYKPPLIKTCLVCGGDGREYVGSTEVESIYSDCPQCGTAGHVITIPNLTAEEARMTIQVGMQLQGGRNFCQEVFKACEAWPTEVLALVSAALEVWEEAPDASDV